MDSGIAGVRSRGNSILLDFTYQGERCRETLRVKPTKATLKEASRKREAILFEIAMGTFDYLNHFPASSKARKFSKIYGQAISIEQALKDWLKKSERHCQLSTIRGYNSVVYHHLIPTFGHLKLTELTANHIEDWLDTLDVSNKRINNILSPLRLVFKDAFFDQLIHKNPLDRVRFLPVEQREPNPLSPAEITKVLNQLDGQARNLFQFAFYSGLRTSELIALRWEDIDLPNNRFYVRVAIVGRKEKTTKTVAGQRTVELNPQTIEALANQQKYTVGAHRVFSDDKTGLPWLCDQAIRKRLWMPALKAAALEYRNPYQTRHTFASMMLSQGKNPLWVADQMGHKDWGMIRKVYGRWIPTD